MTIWYNKDGLAVKMPADESKTGTTGEYSTLGAFREVEMTLDLTTLSTSVTTIVDEGNVTIPSGAQLEEVRIDVVTAAVGSTATFSVGLIRSDYTTVLDATGLVNALAVTAVASAGTVVTLNKGGTTGYGTSLGVVTANQLTITAVAGTATFSAGKVKIKVRYFIP